MKTSLKLAALSLLILSLTACNDGGPDYPIGEGGWFVSLEVGRIPNAGEGFPVSINIDAQAINLSDGSRPTDGSVLRFESSGGSFENGEAQIDIGMRSGAGGSVLQLDRPGRYEISAEYLDESCVTSTIIDVGI